MAPEVSCPAALRLPGRGVGFRGAFAKKHPPPSNRKAVSIANRPSLSASAPRVSRGADTPAC
ncbi:hypothetical protein C0U43_21990 [Klebsiella pneumoniae]|nr:hypothetical protein CKQ79_17680 [Klebsiella pneumoniae]PLC24051.1 hypothetical protein C0U43_21990 [Klebsiella pneumoniae]